MKEAVRILYREATQFLDPNHAESFEKFLFTQHTLCIKDIDCRFIPTIITLYWFLRDTDDALSL